MIMSKNNKIIKLIDLGIKPYEETLSIQENFFNETIEIKKNKDGNLQGTLDSLNNNKYVQFFMNKDDVFVSSIERRSNFEFILMEKKIGSELFGMYDVSTTSEYKNVRFHSPDTLYLSNSIYYLRIK